jgi:hypothetical protein
MGVMTGTLGFNKAALAGCVRDAGGLMEGLDRVMTPQIPLDGLVCSEVSQAR